MAFGTSRRMVRTITWLGIGGTATAGAASAVYQRLSERADRRRFPPPGRMVSVRGRRLHVWLEGGGVDDEGPTVVVVPAMTTSCLEWVRIQRKLIGEHRMFLYDRGGVGWSDWVPGRRTIANLTTELEAVLEAAAVPGPYVLVGHSLGGGIARLFTYRHPKRVVGLVLVDSAHEESELRIGEEFGRFGPVGEHNRWKRAITHYALKPRGVERARVRLCGYRYYHDWAVQEVPAEWVEASVAWDLSTRHRREAIAELTQNNRRHDSELASARGPLGDLPLIVITRAPRPVNAYANRHSEEFNRRWWRIWQPLQQDLADLSTRGRLIVAQRAGHNVHLDEPQLIIEAITDVCAAVAADEE